MTGPEHYREAERLLESGEYDEHEPELVARDTAVAQVHATLALAAATALNDFGASGLPVPDWNAWKAAAGTPKGPDDD